MNEAPIPLGWLCPRCGRIWAPDVRTCDCQAEPETKQSASPVVRVVIDARPWYETRAADA
jgi:uncharacterized OB-fold protein